MEWPVENGKVLEGQLPGQRTLKNYDSMLVLIHFKGHPMGGYGGALKQLSIGCASSAGKAYIHSGGKVTGPEHAVGELRPARYLPGGYGRRRFHRSQALCAGKIAYVAVMKNPSVDCVTAAPWPRTPAWTTWAFCPA